MDSKKIGAFIAENRRKKELTQEQLGERLGVSNKTISRWENGNYMPDLALLEPLSKALGITLNELLAGEEIEKEKAVEHSEKALLTTIDYTDQKIKNEHRKISVFLMGAGLLLCLCAFTVFPSESSWGEVYSILGLLVAVSGVYRELKLSSRLKKGLISAGIFLAAFGLFLAVDYLGVTQFHQPPIYRYQTTTVWNDNKLIEYRNLFYNVYRINADTPNEYYLIDSKKQYDINTVPTSPFDMDKSDIQRLMRFHGSYVGDNSNTGGLIGALPLSEYGFVFEIDSENCGVTVDYHFTDWYGNESLYTEKALIYNSVSAFALIENLQYIRFHFSGSSYFIRRETVEQSYPDYDQIFLDGSVDAGRFRQYVQQKMNDRLFVSKVFAMLEKE